MGYYTSFELTVRGIKNEEEFKSLRQMMVEYEILHADSLNGYAPLSGDGVTFIAPEYEIYFSTYETTKWYDNDADMELISKQFPDATFMLHGEGEEPGDFWNTYYKNGYAEHCVGRITYEQPTRIKW